MATATIDIKAEAADGVTETNDSQDRLKIDTEMDHMIGIRIFIITNQGMATIETIIQDQDQQGLTTIDSISNPIRRTEEEEQKKEEEKTTREEAWNSI